ncbi:MAG: hypothetical protein BWK80_15010 [Desulfobacteraceae bacterium IS3]|nr:MAG: hypothetical protein BWK80_15010 [Desulfobacteraceae bacterium IS3]
MLKQEEYFDFIRRDEKSDARSTEASYTAIEEPWVKRYQEIQTKLAGLGKEHGELRDKKKLGLTPEEDARFKQLQEDLKAANRKFQDFLAELVTELGKVGTERAAEIGEKNLDKLKALQGTLKELGQGSVVIHYLMTDEKLRMILTTPNIQLVRDSLISAKDLNQKIFAFRETLQNPRKNPLPQARDLYDAVFKPIAEDLKQAHAQTLMISLDSTMRYIPISALHDGAQYVAEQYRIVIFTEAAKTKLTGQPVSQLKLAGLGLTKQIAGFNPLPSVKDELEGIAKIIPGVIHLDETFTKDIFTDVLDTQYPVLHISSHFVFKPGTENDSFLLLGNGDKLSLADIRNDNFDFNSVDLLSLSACETAMGGGKDANGREIEGFGALAQNQGAKAVLATLWPVADKSTGIFMQKMHELRKDKKSSKAEALQSAQILFIRGSGQKPGSGGQEQAQRGKVIYSESADKDVFKPDPEKPYAHPFFWAPFILMGNWL